MRSHSFVSPLNTSMTSSMQIMVKTNQIPPLILRNNDLSIIFVSRQGGERGSSELIKFAIIKSPFGKNVQIRDYLSLHLEIPSIYGRNFSTTQRTALSPSAFCVNTATKPKSDESV